MRGQGTCRQCRCYLFSSHLGMRRPVPIAKHIIKQDACSEFKSWRYIFTLSKNCLSKSMVFCGTALLKTKNQSNLCYLSYTHPIKHDLQLITNFQPRVAYQRYIRMQYNDRLPLLSNYRSCPCQNFPFFHVPFLTGRYVVRMLLLTCRWVTMLAGAQFEASILPWLQWHGIDYRTQRSQERQAGVATCSRGAVISPFENFDMKLLRF